MIEPGDKVIARARVVRELLLLDLRGKGAMLAGSVAAVCKTADVEISQAWSRHFYEDPGADYGPIDGLIYLNAHNDDEAVALYERAQAGLKCPKSRIARLDDNALRSSVFATAEANNLDVAPY